MFPAGRVQLYEESAGAEALVIERIERFLGETVVRPIDLFDWSARDQRDGEGMTPATRPEPSHERTHPRAGESLRDGVVRQLDGMGLEVTVTIRAPFDALARTPDVLLAAVGSLRTALHRAEVLHGLARVAEGHALFVVRDPVTRSAISGLPILTITELRRHRDPDELIEEITEREGP